MLLLDSILQDGKSHTLKELSSRIEGGSYSTRTIQRDLECMRDTIGCPIESDWQGFRYTESGFFIKTLMLTEGEAFSVAVLNPLLEQYRNTPLEGQLRSVFKKITSYLPDKITVDTSFLNPKITFIPDRAEHVQLDSFKTAFDALKSCRSLTFEYRPLQKSTFMERKLDPYHIICQRGNWYVIGHCHDKNEVRIFSLSRMKKVKITSEKFTVPATFKAQDYFDAEMGVWLSDKTPLTVEILCDKEIGTYALNRVWHSEQVVEERDDGSVYVKFKTTQKKEILRWILGQGHTVKVLAPAELVDEVKAEIEKMRGMYNEK